jgi:hypothetical protein
MANGSSPDLTRLDIKHVKRSERNPLLNRTSPFVVTRVEDPPSLLERLWSWVALPEGWKLYIPYHMITVSTVEIILFYTIDTVKELGLLVPIPPYEGWRVVTCMLAHANAAHLWNN